MQQEKDLYLNENFNDDDEDDEDDGWQNNQLHE